MICVLEVYNSLLVSARKILLNQKYGLCPHKKSFVALTSKNPCGSIFLIVFINKIYAKALNQQIFAEKTNYSAARFAYIKNFSYLCSRKSK